MLAQYLPIELDDITLLFGQWFAQRCRGEECFRGANELVDFLSQAIGLFRMLPHVNLASLLEVAFFATWDHKLEMAIKRGTDYICIRNPLRLLKNVQAKRVCGDG